MTAYKQVAGHLVKLVRVNVGDKTITVLMHSARCMGEGCPRFRKLSKQVTGGINSMIGGKP